MSLVKRIKNNSIVFADNSFLVMTYSCSVSVLYRHWKLKRSLLFCCPKKKYMLVMQKGLSRQEM